MGNRIQLIKDEITTDPLNRGYAGMSDAEIASDMNTNYVEKQRGTAQAVDIYEWIDTAEFQAKNSTQQGYVRDVLGLSGDIKVGPGSQARSVFLSVFGAGSTTIQTILAGLTYTVSRAYDLFYAAQISTAAVTPGEVAEARA